MTLNDNHLIRLAAVAKHIENITGRTWNHDDLLQLLHDHQIDVTTKRGRKHPEYLSDAINAADADALCDKLRADQDRS